MELQELSLLSGRDEAGEGVEAPGRGLARMYVVVLGAEGDTRPCAAATGDEVGKAAVGWAKMSLRVLSAPITVLTAG